MSSATPDSSILPPCDVLREMYVTGEMPDRSGKRHPVRAEVEAEHAAACYRVVKERQPELAIEVGMACGSSTLAMLTAMEENGRGKLISLDPYQDEWFHGVGTFAVEKAGLAHRHELIQEPSFLALPRLLGEGVRVDLAYQDGMHEFGFEIVDLFYLGRMLTVGGYLGLNDCRLPAVHLAIRYLLSRPDFEERPVVPTSYRGRTPLTTLIRFLLRRPVQDRWFEKVEEWEPDFDWWRRF
ncbi:MAG: class I SAM-dependent methyltransferase [Acidobacteriota bacterium]